ncbi:MAG: P-loop NTPase, partial [Nitrospirota bacterium]|nr:P-loop NTPase [Nitrospirota bacterium]MDX2420421.1 P-loop NTPase [Nitrospirota bacterium]
MAEEQHPAHSAPAANQPEENLLPGVKHIIAVSSGKGGVGKSTVTVNMAVALKQEGYAVGIMDADIYGPNIPMMIGVTKEPIKEGDKITPAEGQGVKVISMGFFVPEDTPVVWRGPMVHGAIQQFFRDVVWGELDYLLIDLPPGTGDVPLTLSQLVPLTG